MSGPIRPAGLPPLGRSWLKPVYGVVGAGVVAAYLLQAFTGWEPTRARKEFVPASVRSSPGGYRSFHYWHRGYHGGK